MSTKRETPDVPRPRVVIFRKSPNAPRAWLFIHRPRPDAEKSDGSSAAESGDGRQ